MKKYRNVFIIFLFLLACSVSSHTAFAASSTINISPETGSYATPFSVNLVIDGHGDTFNAAQATVTLSSNFAANNLVLGDCNFSFLITPTITNPSFAGVILDGSSKKCTLYTLTLVPTATGKATVTLSHPEIKRYKDAANILSSVQNGGYLLTSVANAKDLATIPTMQPIQNNQYAAVIKIQTDTNTPVENTEVTLTSDTSKTSIQAQTNSTGEAQFNDLHQGIYEATVKGYPGHTIINIAGQNHSLVLGIRVQQQLITTPLLLGGALLLGTVIGIIATVFLWPRIARTTN